MARRPVTRFRDLTSAEKARLLVWLDWTQQHLLAREEDQRMEDGGCGRGYKQATATRLARSRVRGADGGSEKMWVMRRVLGRFYARRGGIRHVIPAKARYW